MASLYLSVNKIFADKVISADDDFVCVHVYHLMVLPTFLRKRFNRVNLGFFLDIPFPSSEIYRPLPVRNELALRASTTRTKNRAILVDYYGIMVQPGSIRTTSSNETIQTLKSLFSDPKNIVFLVNGKDRKTLTEWFSSCDDLGLAAVAEIFACTVGQKPRKAKYYLDETAEIVKMLEGLATSTAAISDQTASTTDVPTKIL
ncbi:hypothetical protein Bca101_086040 [Brassica carinata]